MLNRSTIYGGYLTAAAVVHINHHCSICKSNNSADHGAYWYQITAAMEYIQQRHWLWCTAYLLITTAAVLCIKQQPCWGRKIKIRRPGGWVGCAGVLISTKPPRCLFSHPYSVRSMEQPAWETATEQGRCVWWRTPKKCQKAPTHQYFVWYTTNPVGISSPDAIHVLRSTADRSDQKSSHRLGTTAVTSVTSDSSRSRASRS